MSGAKHENLYRPAFSSQLIFRAVSILSNTRFVLCRPKLPALFNEFKIIQFAGYVIIIIRGYIVRVKLNHFNGPVRLSSVHRWTKLWATLMSSISLSLLFTFSCAFCTLIWPYAASSVNSESYRILPRPLRQTLPWRGC